MMNPDNNTKQHHPQAAELSTMTSAAIQARIDALPAWRGSYIRLNGDQVTELAALRAEAAARATRPKEAP